MADTDEQLERIKALEAEVAELQRQQAAQPRRLPKPYVAPSDWNDNTKGF